MDNCFCFTLLAARKWCPDSRSAIALFFPSRLSHIGCELFWNRSSVKNPSLFCRLPRFFGPLPGPFFSPLLVPKRPITCSYGETTPSFSSSPFLLEHTLTFFGLVVIPTRTYCPLTGDVTVLYPFLVGQISFFPILE